MIDEIQKLLDQYIVWLKDKTSLRQIDDWVEITTPYLDRHNDYLQIYARKENGNYILSDDGYTIIDLEHSGCQISTPKRQQLLLMTLNGFGVMRKDKELQIQTSTDNFAQNKHNLIQAILAVNDMFYLAEQNIRSLFYEDVESWLNMHDIRYSPQVKLPGRMGYDHKFDFLIPKSKSQPERILRAINNPNRSMAQSFVLAWIDTKDNRPDNSRAYALLNDSEKGIPSDVITALKNYDVKPILWSHRDAIRDELAA